MRKIVGVLFVITAFVLLVDGFKLMTNDVPSVFQLALAFILSGVSAVGAALVMFRGR